MHNNVLGLQWERRKRREEDKEAKVSQGRQRCRFLVLLWSCEHPTLLAARAALVVKEEDVCQKSNKNR